MVVPTRQRSAGPWGSQAIWSTLLGKFQANQNPNEARGHLDVITEGAHEASAKDKELSS